MSPRLRSIVTVGLLAATTFVLYSPGLNPGVADPEQLALLKQIHGYPLFFHAADGSWRQPIPIYFTAILGARAPVWMAAINVALIYLAASRVLRDRWMPLIAAALLLLCPAHVFVAQRAGDAIYPVPFVLAWLVCLLAFFDRPRPWILFVSGLCLGVGVYTQPSAPVTMVALLILALTAAAIEGHRAPATFGAALAGFGLPLLAMAPWFAMHPETYPDTMGAWAIQKAHIRVPMDGVRAVLNWNTLSTRTSIYWETLNPSFLFLASAGAPEVGMAGPPLAFSLLLLVPAGIARALTTMRGSIALLLIGGLLVSPLAASTFGQRHPIGAALPVIVFIALLGCLGAAHMLESRTPWIRYAGLLLLGLVPVQIVLFS